MRRHRDKIIRRREILGVWIKDRFRYEWSLLRPGRGYLSLRNRREVLERSPYGVAYACRWRFTSQLHAPIVQPALGQRLLKRCLEHAPIGRSTATPPAKVDPQVSVLIGHRGLERLPLLLATLESFAAQSHVRFECLVIEHDCDSLISGQLPSWVRHLHIPVSPGTPYNRSQTFNTGAQHSRAPVLLLHDNDMLVPEQYLSRILERLALGYEVINPKRFVFYLTQTHSLGILSGSASLCQQPPEAIVQNLEAGGSMAIIRKAYEHLGGMDESFVGWGGEDNEFWDRCLTLPTWIWGYEPIVHLWHSSQPEKRLSENANLTLLREILQLAAGERIARLKGHVRSECSPHG